MRGESQAVKYTVKDSVFTSLFREKKYLMQLYRTLHPEDEETTEEGLTDITIKNVLVNGTYNDLGFMAGNKLLILVEAQATWTMNIIVRALLYLSQTYQDYFETRGADLYGSKKVELPKPELYVIYTGDRLDRPETVRLTEEFFEGEESAIEVKVRMLYGDESWGNKDIDEERDIISQYIAFTKVYNEQRKLYARTKKTITETIRICKDRNLLKEYLESREREVKDIMFTLFDEERAIEIHVANIAKEAAEKAAKEAAEKAAREAAEKAAREAKEAAEKAEKEAEKAVREAAEKAARETEKAAIEKMMKKGKMTVEEIADCFTNFSLEEIRQMEKDLAQAMK